MRGQEEALELEESALGEMQSTTLTELRELNEQLIQQHAEIAACEHLQSAATVASGARLPLSSKSSNSQAAPATSKAGSMKGKDSFSRGLSPSALRMPPVSECEFSSIPSYMRGRLERSKLNGAIEAWLAALKNKYTLLAMPHTHLSAAQQEQVDTWKQADGDETAGSFFLSSDDLRQCAPLQALGSTNLKAVLHGLRHIGRVKNATVAGAAPKYLLV